MTTRLPAEWEPQRLVLFAFPRADGDWEDQLDAVSFALVEAAIKVAAACPVLILIPDTAHFKRVGEAAGAARINEAGIRLFPVPLNDSWVRDFGPITVFRNGAPTLLDFDFNGWGGKYPAALDNAATARLHPNLPGDYGYERIRLVLEGGSIDSDGAGTLLTTSACLLSGGRNGWTTKAEAETALRQHLGAERILWIDHGKLEGDDTDAHVDTLVRFLDAETIAYVSCDDPADPHYRELLAMRRRVEALRTAAGRPYRLVELPWVPAIHASDDGRRLPASYANFLLCNGTLFLPTYCNDSLNQPAQWKSDARAVGVLQRYGKYRVVPVDCRSFIEQHGALHCLTASLFE